MWETKNKIVFKGEMNFNKGERKEREGEIKEAEKRFNYYDFFFEAFNYYELSNEKLLSS